ncbi:MAG: hypothetical protein ACK4UN_05035 [Limisphaerales bacterium]
MVAVVPVVAELRAAPWTPDVLSVPEALWAHAVRARGPSADLVENAAGGDGAAHRAVETVLGDDSAALAAVDQHLWARLAVRQCAEVATQEPLQAQLNRQLHVQNPVPDLLHYPLPGRFPELQQQHLHSQLIEVLPRIEVSSLLLPVAPSQRKPHPQREANLDSCLARGDRPSV